MKAVGIDCGAKTIKVVILTDGRLASTSIVPSGIDTAGAAKKAYAEALKRAGLGRAEIDRVVATGAGRNEVRFADETVTEVGADAKGAFLLGDARTLIDVGAEEGRAIRIDDRGKVLDFAVNDKCAAGTGAFTEAMARALEIPLEQMGPLSLESTRRVSLNAQCVVFAESELVTLIHARTPKADMARAIHDAIAERIAAMVRRVGVEKEVVLIGGLSRNVGFVSSLGRELEERVQVPDEPEFVGALGAARIAAERGAWALSDGGQWEQRK